MLTGTLGCLHAFLFHGCHWDEGWSGFGNRIHRADFKKLASARAARSSSTPRRRAPASGRSAWCSATRSASSRKATSSTRVTRAPCSSRTPSCERCGRAAPPRRGGGLLRRALLPRRPALVDRADRRLGHEPLPLRAEGRPAAPGPLARGVPSGGGGPVPGARGARRAPRRAGGLRALAGPVDPLRVCRRPPRRRSEGRRLPRTRSALLLARPGRRAERAGARPGPRSVSEPGRGARHAGDGAGRGARADATLWLVPTDYLGSGTTDYLEELGAGLAAEIEVGWTGRTVLSPTILAEEARSRSEALRRPLLLWDNTPVSTGRCATCCT